MRCNRDFERSITDLEKLKVSMQYELRNAHEGFKHHTKDFHESVHRDIAKLEEVKDKIITLS